MQNRYSKFLEQEVSKKPPEEGRGWEKFLTLPEATAKPVEEPPRRGWRQALKDPISLGLYPPTQEPTKLQGLGLPGGPGAGMLPIYTIRKPVKMAEPEQELPPPRERYTIGPTEYKPTLMERILGEVYKRSSVLGEFDPHYVSETARAQDKIKQMAAREGVPIHEYRGGTATQRFLEQAYRGFIDTATWGVYPAVKETITGEEAFEPTSSVGHIGSALGSLAGLIASPFPVAKAGFGATRAGMKLLIPNSPILKMLTVTGKEGTAALIAKTAIQDAIILGSASALSSIGGATKETTFTDAAKHLGHAALSGAVTGAIFGATKGMFPDQTTRVIAQRIVVGLVGLNAQRAVETGGNPFLDRPLAEVVFDILLDVFFLRKGLPEGGFEAIEKDLSKVVAKSEEISNVQDLMKNIPPEDIQRANLEALKMEKTQLDLEIDRIVKRVAQGMMRQAENQRKANEIPKVKAEAKGPVELSRLGDPEYEFVSKKGNRYVKIGEDWYRADVDDTKGMKQRNQFVIKAAEKGKKKVGSKIEQTKPESTLAKEAAGRGEKLPVPSEAEQEKNLAEMRRRAMERTFGEEPEEEIKKAEALTVEEKKAVVEEPTEPTEPELMVTGEQLNAAAKKLGKEPEDLTEAEVREFLAGEEPDVYPDKYYLMKNMSDALEEYYKKPRYDITEKEVEDFFVDRQKRDAEVRPKIEQTIEEKPEEKPEPLTEVDRLTGSEEPKEFIGEDSIFFQDKDTVEALKEDYAGRESVAESFDDLMDTGLDIPREVGTTIWDLIHKMNRWYHGEDVDVEGTRDFLSEIAARMDELESKFVDKPGYPESREYEKAWELAEEAAVWASRLDRPKIERTEGPEGTTLNVFIDPTKAPPAVRKMFEEFKRLISSEKGLGRNLKTYRTVQDIWEQTGFYLNPFDRRWRFEIDDSKLEWKRDPETIPESERVLKTSWRQYSLGEMIEYPELFEAYPEARDIKVKRQKATPDMEGGAQGWFDSRENSIIISPDSSDHKRTLIHEIQHWVQTREGFATGSAVREAVKKANPEQLKRLSDKALEALEFSERTHKEIIKYLRDRLDKTLKVKIRGDSDRVNELIADYIDQTLVHREANNNYLAQNPGKYDFHETRIGKKLNAEIEDTLGKVADIIGVDKDVAADLITEFVTGEGGFKKQKDPDAVGKIRRGLVDKITKTTEDLLVDERNRRRLESYADTNVLFAWKNALSMASKVNREAYMAVAGEIEAREATDRMDLSAGSRREIVPEREASKFDPKDVIVSFDEPSEVGYAEVRGAKLYSGLDPEEAKRQAVKAARGVYEYIRESRELKKFNAKKAAEQIRKFATKGYVERSGNLRRKALEELGDEGYRLIWDLYLQKGAHPKASRMLEQMQKEVDRGLTKNEKIVKEGLITAMRMVDIGGYKTPKQFSFPEKLEPTKSVFAKNLFASKAVNEVEDLSPERAAKVRRAAENYFKWMRKVVKDAYDEGLISEQELKDLTEHNYKRTRLVEDIYDKKQEVMIGGHRITVNDSGIQRLQKGKKSDIYETNSSVVALEAFTRLYGRIYKNKANKVLLEIARADKDNQFVRIKEGRPADPKEWYKVSYVDRKGVNREIYIADKVEQFKQFAEKSMGREESKALNDFIEQDADHKLTKLPRDFGGSIPAEFRINRTYVYEKGQRKTLFLSPDIAEEWLASSAQTTERFARTIRFVSASPLLKTFATGINWSFALKNLPRDIMTAWFAARTFDNGKWKSVYSPHSPKFATQLGRDFANVAHDVITRTGRHDDYINEGGGQEYLTVQGRWFRKGKFLGNELDKFYKVMGYPGITSELMTRLAIRDRVIRNRAKELGITFEEAKKDPKITKEATFAARDYLDFSQGGEITKALDNGLPYFNARIQAMRGIVRSFHPKGGTAAVSMYKLAQFAGIAAGLYIGNQHLHPKTMAALKNDRRAQGGFVFPLGDMFGFEDKFGETRYPFIVIPVDQTMKFFKLLFEASADQWLGNEVDVKSLVQALRDFSPADATTLPPSISGGLGYVTNENLWLGGDIWKRSEAIDWPGSAVEKTKRTPELLVDIGEKTGLSPERLKYVMGQLITNDNMYAQLLGKGYQEMFGSLPQSKRERFLAEWISSVPVASALFKITNPYSQFSDITAKAEEKSTIDRLIQFGGLDNVVDGYLYEGTHTRADVYKYMRSFKDAEIYDKLEKDFEFQKQIKDMPGRSFWVTLRRQSLDARAESYLRALERDPETVKKGYNWIIGRDPKGGMGVITEGFMDAVAKARRNR